MITVRIVRDNTRKVTGVFVNGHSGYAEEGSDIVCAGASTLVYTLANSLEKICGIDTDHSTRIAEDMGDGKVSAEIIIPETRFRDEGAADRAQVIMETVVTGFMTLASSVNKDGNRYINIIEEI
ncbi:MAG: ribosomal-processing cysteine protease Prp [Clostridiales bacterium]|nr:ribosomal-processing cysteine protease Prp [Clostridiales bacterium]